MRQISLCRLALFIWISCVDWAAAGKSCAASSECSLADLTDASKGSGAVLLQSIRPSTRTLEVGAVDNRSDPDDHGPSPGSDEQADGSDSGHAAHHRPSRSATVIAVMLLGFVTLTMSIFYLTNFPKRAIRDSTWKLLSYMISLFCAVLIFAGLKDAMCYLFGEAKGDHHSPPDLKTIGLSFVRLMLLWSTVEVMLLHYRHKLLPLKAWGNIGAHVVGFAAIDFFGDVQHYDPFPGHVMLCFLAVIIAFLGMGCLSLLGAALRRALLDEKGFDDLDEQRRETEDEMTFIATGMLLSLVIRFMITGHLPPTHGAPRDKTSREVGLLLGASAVLFLMLVIVSRLLHRLSESETVRRSVVICQGTLAMTLGWCLVSWAQWTFWYATDGKGMGQSDKMAARMLMAVSDSVIAVVGICSIEFCKSRVGMDKTTHKAVRQVLGLLLGLSWEGAFAQAEEGLGDKFQDGGHHMLAVVGLSLSMCLVVLPAWALFILPRSQSGDDELEASLETLTRSASCPARLNEFQADELRADAKAVVSRGLTGPGSCT
eukprot:gnl/TRDRNA2_/TRDRNA2_168855_c0_seq4.p1 gnl/TRDRNA2_/TRDRNA2_168855_c0~~gnl/TRDRNA2_/TRDRNA2_168855_c0_seq4.p1  ORF type:complete len:543 (-),score=45.52 gnl/TRDRNA2_/TRDRNA2_168855_c0_seq4:142-1770(-)